MATFGDLYDKDDTDKTLALVAENIRLREELALVRLDRKALGTVLVALTEAVEQHRDAKKSTDYSYWPDQYDFRLWAMVDDSVPAVTNAEPVSE